MATVYRFMGVTAFVLSMFFFGINDGVNGRYFSIIGMFCLVLFDLNKVR